MSGTRKKQPQMDVDGYRFGTTGIAAPTTPLASVCFNKLPIDERN